MEWGHAVSTERQEVLTERWGTVCARQTAKLLNALFGCLTQQYFLKKSNAIIKLNFKKREINTDLILTWKRRHFFVVVFLHLLCTPVTFLCQKESLPSPLRSSSNKLKRESNEGGKKGIRQQNTVL